MKIKRLLLKLSGEALQGRQDGGIDVDFLHDLSAKVAKIEHSGNQLVIVIGWGNIFRGVSWAAKWIDRASADYMGMMATIINGVALSDAIEKAGCQTRIMSGIEVDKVAEPFIRRRALRHLEKGRVIICVGGTGNPFFTTDSAAVLRGLELDCNVVVKGTKVDGVYDRDPVKHGDAKRYSRVSYDTAIEKNLRIFDQSAFALARDEHMPIFVCRIEDIDKFSKNDVKLDFGTLISSEGE